MLLVGLGLLLLSSCRNSQPPKIEVCIGDGFGGSDCIEADGSKLYRSPTMLKDYWMTSQPDMKNWASWCYQSTPGITAAAMKNIEVKIHGQD